MNKLAVVLVLIIAAMSLVLVQQQSSIRQLKEALANTKADSTLYEDSETLRKENQQMANELTALKYSQRELIRLRGEVGVLRKQAQQGTYSAQPAPAIETNEIASLVDTNSYTTNTYTLRTKSVVGRGQTLVTGGWQVTAGKRTFMLVTPQAQGAASDHVQMNTIFVEGPETLLTEAGLDFGSAGRDSSSSRVLDGGQAETLVNKLLASQGVDVLTYPAMTAINGRKTVLNSAEIKSEPGQEKPAFNGPIVQVTPTLSQDGQSYELDVVGQMTREGL